MIAFTKFSWPYLKLFCPCRFALGKTALLSLEVGRCVLINLMPRASLDRDAASFFRLSRKVHVFSLELQGSSLPAMPQAFNELLIMLEGMRERGRRRMELIGLTRTGITSPMAVQIAQAVLQMPPLGQGETAEVLEMLQVSMLSHPLLYSIDARLSADELF
jgi:hypothetical protein